MPGRPGEFTKHPLFVIQIHKHTHAISGAYAEFQIEITKATASDGHFAFCQADEETFFFHPLNISHSFKVGR